MLFQNRIYDLEIDRMKLPKLAGIFFTVSLFFLFLLTIGTFGPQKMIIDPIPSLYCENALKFSEDSQHTETEVEKPSIQDYRCIACKDFIIEQNAKIINFRLDLYTAPENLNQFEELETLFNTSILESQSSSASCDNIAQISRQSSFPLVEQNLLDQYNGNFMDSWKLVINGHLFTGAPMCGEKDHDTGKTKCTYDMYGDIDFHEAGQKLALMFSFPLSEEQKQKVDALNLYMIYNNIDFYKFIFFFQVAISLASLAAFVYIVSKLVHFKTKDWLAIHKWMMALLLTQAFLDNTFAILNDFIESETLAFLSELGKNIHLTLLLYFWISVFDRILLKNMPGSMMSEWSEKIKVTLLTSFFILNFSYKVYIGIESIENDYDDLFRLRILLNLIKFLITFLEVCYGIYFIMLTVLYIKQLHEGKIFLERTSMVLFVFTTISFVLTTISLMISPYSENSFEYLAVRGFIGIYTVTVGILYVPHGARVEKSSDLDTTKLSEREQIIQNVYHSDESEEDKLENKITNEEESDKERERKKLIWEKIQKEVENEAPEKNSKDELEDEEYMYM